MIKKFNEFVNESKNETELYKLLDKIYQDSIDTLKDQWDSARDNDDPNILIDAIEIYYEKDRSIKNYLKKHKLNYDTFWNKHVDKNNMSVTDYLYEWIDAGIN